VLVGVGSVKGSPGATTLALGLASVWPGTSVLLVEADPSGGDVGLWWEIGSDPGLVSLAGAARRGRPGDVDVLDHAYEADPGLWVVPGPAGAEQARAALHVLVDRAGLLPTLTGPAHGPDDGRRFDAVIVDLGRLDPASPARGLVGVLDVLLVVSRDSIADLTHLAAAAPDLTDGTARATTGVVLTQGCRYRTREVEEAIGGPVVAVLPPDPVTAAALAGTRTGAGGRRRRGQAASPLLTTLGELVPRLSPRADLALDPDRPPAPVERLQTARALRAAPRTAQEAGWTRPASARLSVTAEATDPTVADRRSS